MGDGRGHGDVFFADGRFGGFGPRGLGLRLGGFDLVGDGCGFAGKGGGEHGGGGLVDEGAAVGAEGADEGLDLVGLVYKV